MTTMKTTASPDVATPISLDTHHVQNWDMKSICSILNPQASQHEQLAWCYGQVKEMHDLLWGYISLPTTLSSETLHELSARMLIFIEARMTPLVGLLGVMCDQSSKEDRAARVGATTKGETS